MTIRETKVRDKMEIFSAMGALLITMNGKELTEQERLVATIAIETMDWACFSEPHKYLDLLAQINRSNMEKLMDQVKDMTPEQFVRAVEEAEAKEAANAE